MKRKLNKENDIPQEPPPKRRKIILPTRDEARLELLKHVLPPKTVFGDDLFKDKCLKEILCYIICTAKEKRIGLGKVVTSELKKLSRVTSDISDDNVFY
jgi:hypothetical protein